MRRSTSTGVRISGMVRIFWWFYNINPLPIKMGLLSFIMSAPKMEHIKMAYGGRYVYHKLQDIELKSELY